MRVRGGGAADDETVTLGGARPNVIVVPLPLELVANACPEMLVTIRGLFERPELIWSAIMIRFCGKTPS